MRLSCALNHLLTYLLTYLLIGLSMFHTLIHCVTLLWFNRWRHIPEALAYRDSQNCRW